MWNVFRLIYYLDWPTNNVEKYVKVMALHKVSILYDTLWSVCFKDDIRAQTTGLAVKMTKFQTENCKYFWIFTIKFVISF